ncbi:MAG: hypothetical protein RMK29_18245 [Myxococcales bacterium]|nr:hypothetical protein [Myxococcota bacterium]MDW8283653.1 hypothetical protein [Myxococcales bacterium]
MRSLLLVVSAFLVGCPVRPPVEEDLAPGEGRQDLASADLAVAMPTAFLDLDTLYQDCMPPVRPDPLLIKGRMTVRNVSGSPLGPVGASEGLILHRDGAQLATFRIGPLNLGTIPPHGAVEGRVFDKEAGTLMPARGCQTIPCNEPVRIEILLTGGNLPSGSRARSAPYNVACAF